MEDKRRVLKALKHNVREFIMVFASFTIMVAVAYFFIGSILENRLRGRVEEVIATVEANVKVGFSEGEATLRNSYYALAGMLEHGMPRYEILAYLRTTTEWMTQSEPGILNFYGIYGYINGLFYDSIGLNPGADFIPQRQPWYQTAVRSGRAIGYTAPYPDVRTGSAIISIVQNVYNKDDDIVGILSIDVDSERIGQYVAGLTQLFDGYGILLSQNMAIMAHPDGGVLGHQFQDLGGDFALLARDLRSGEKVFDSEIEDRDGTTAIVFFKKMYNGWYVGSIIPKTKFYGDRYLAALILLLLGLSLAISLCYVLLRLSMARVRSEEENKYKSNFLARMSHEIRTPMNAISGMAELLLREDLPAKSHEYVQDIKHASGNLVSIVNDILDFSKIEAGQLQITPTKYVLASLVQDTINIIRLRLSEKPIRFITNIDSNLPSSLIGDEVRLRQILLNLLSNAVKYTDRGHIALTLTGEKSDAKHILLKIEVVDTGRGITPENQAKLFSEFIQVDLKKNSGIEGTGLGLAITRSLCIAMGGSISLKSEYGKGSTFEASVLQEIDSYRPFASVDRPEKKKVLIFEHRRAYAQSLCWSLDNLKVPCKMVSSIEDFTTAVSAEKWAYILTDYGIYKIYRRIREIMEESTSAISDDQNPGLILTVAMGTENPMPNVSFLSLPVHTLSLANVLNGQATYTELLGSTRTDNIIRYIFPAARILVVDDMLTNLKVTEGLLAPYEARVDTCLSGLDAIELIKKFDYDIVFLDHMMPGMDGIETAHRIRALGTEYAQKIPIIALTANAIHGTEEMFYEHGFQAFISKPIDVMEMDSVIRKWVRDDKHKDVPVYDEPSASGIQAENLTIDIPGVDTKKGLSMYVGARKVYLPLLRSFAANTPGVLDKLRAVSAETLHDYAITVHGLKGSSAGIGAETVREAALNLETMSRAGDLRGVLALNGKLIADAENIVANVKAWLEQHDAASEKKPRLKTPDRELLARLRRSCESYDIDGIDKAMSELESADYEEGADLVEWLRKKIAVSRMSEAAQRLAKEEF